MNLDCLAFLSYYRHKEECNERYISLLDYVSDRGVTAGLSVAVGMKSTIFTDTLTSTQMKSIIRLTCDCVILDQQTISMSTRDQRGP
jgi:hypothetical protein